MSIKDYNKVINIIDACTGNIIDTIKIKNYNPCTIQEMINDLILNDFDEDQHGILIKYGIEP